MIKNKTYIKIPTKKIVRFCKQNHILKLSFFGSILRDDFTQDSDIDLLVEFDPMYIPGLFDLIKMEEELSIMFTGHKVDLRTSQDLSRYFRDDVLESAEELYAKK